MTDETIARIGRMETELSSLNSNLSRLDSFRASEHFNALENTEQSLLVAQACAMASYGSILQARISLAKSGAN